MKELSKEQVEYAVGCFVGLYQSRGIKQTEFERISGVKQSTISKIVHPQEGEEKYTPSPETLQKLFQALGVKLTDILNEVDHLADEIVGYLATPLTALSPKEDGEVRRLVKTIRSVAAEEEFVDPRFDIYWPGDYTHPKQHADITAGQVYVTDRSRASTHDFIVLFCGPPSYGVGQENEIATQAGVPAIRLAPPDGLSRMMLGSFVRADDVPYSGTLDSGISFDEGRLREALREVRQRYFRTRALYCAINGGGFGKRLRKLIGGRCNGNYLQFASDIGISLPYLHRMMDEPIIVTNPSALILRRMAHRLGERVAFLLGEAEENDAVWLESNTSWRSWFERSQSVVPRIAFEMRDEWRNSYKAEKREEQTVASFRKPSRLMREADWDKKYLALTQKKVVGAEQGRLL